MQYLVPLWDGGGTVPVEMGVVRRLVARGHAVTVLGDPTLADEAAAASRTLASPRASYCRTRPRAKAAASPGTTGPRSASISGPRTSTTARNRPSLEEKWLSSVCCVTPAAAATSASRTSS